MVQEQHKTAEKKEEVVAQPIKETSNLKEPQFKCEVCGAKFKKEITMNKHFDTKHKNQKCKVCNVTFNNSIEVLQHVAKEHSKNILENISVKEKEQLSNGMRHEEDISEYEENIDLSIKFRCYKCKEIVPINDKFNDDLQENQMCKLCTMTEAYG